MSQGCKGRAVCEGYKNTKTGHKWHNDRVQIVQRLVAKCVKVGMEDTKGTKVGHEGCKGRVQRAQMLGPKAGL